MRLLLDTHALIWLLEGDPQTPVVVREEAARTGNELWVSAVALWELTIKIALGKLAVKLPLAGLFNQVLPQQRIVVLPIQTAHLLQLAQLPLHHRDPFDRLMAAQALVEAMTVASKDSAFDAYGVQQLW